MKKLPIIIICLIGILMIYASFGLPYRGDVNSPANRDTSAVGSIGAANYYIRSAIQDSNTPNIVTVVLADWRGYDTLGETTVIFTAGLVCYLLLRRREDENTL